MNNEIYKKIIDLLPKPLTIYVKDYINPSVVYLLEQAEENLDKNERLNDFYFIFFFSFSL